MSIEENQESDAGARMVGEVLGKISGAIQSLDAVRSAGFIDDDTLNKAQEGLRRLLEVRKKQFEGKS